MVPNDLVRLPELDAAWAVRGSGARLDAVRRAGRKLRDRILAGGAARCVRTVDVATFPYPTRYGLQGVASSPARTFMRGRMHPRASRLRGGAQKPISILVNPTTRSARRRRRTLRGSSSATARSPAIYCRRFTRPSNRRSRAGASRPMRSTT